MSCNTPKTMTKQQSYCIKKRKCIEKSKQHYEENKKPTINTMITIIHTRHYLKKKDKKERICKKLVHEYV